MAILDLYVNAYGAEKDNWTKVGTSPYLDAQDQPTNYGWTTTKKAEWGDFGFTDSGKTTETINSVTLYIYGQCPGTGMDVFIWDGAAWTEFGNPAIPPSWGWFTVDVISVLDTWTKIDAAKLYIEAANAEDRHDIDCAYLKVDYTVGGVDHFQTVTDLAGLLESVSSIKGQIQTVSDLAGLLDSVSKKHGVKITASDLAGLLDSVSLTVDGKKAVSDLAGLLDSVSSVKGQFVTVSDLAGLLDTVIAVWGGTQTVEDLAGLLESVAIRKDAKQIVSDLAGLLDSVGKKHGIVKGVSDIGGLTESVSMVYAGYEAPSDLAGLFDSVVVVHTPGVAAPAVRGRGRRRRRAVEIPPPFLTPEQLEALRDWLEVKSRIYN